MAGVWFSILTKLQKNIMNYNLKTQDIFGLQKAVFCKLSNNVVS